ncbi:hypothetical protein [Marinobacterium stanieri]|uniref:hypothetical protein n=1 Tax=Marinobacterium stanieri TaxID=49186 RepID=UPI000255A5EA|nr:hypothetical protein [Marinobacterium stanieri]
MGEAAVKLELQAEPKTIAWVDVRLCRWAEWVERERMGGGNTQQRNVIATLMDCRGVMTPSTGYDAWSMPDAVYDTDQAVRKLPAEQNQVVIEHYRHMDAPESTRVARCNCSRRTYYRRLARAHQSIMMLLKAPAKRRTQGSARDRMMASMKKPAKSA